MAIDSGLVDRVGVELAQTEKSVSDLAAAGMLNKAAAAENVVNKMLDLLSSMVTLQGEIVEELERVKREGVNNG